MLQYGFPSEGTVRTLLLLSRYSHPSDEIDTVFLESHISRRPPSKIPQRIKKKMKPVTILTAVLLPLPLATASPFGDIVCLTICDGLARVCDAFVGTFFMSGLVCPVIHGSCLAGCRTRGGKPGPGDDEDDDEGGKKKKRGRGNGGKKKGNTWCTQSDFGKDAAPNGFRGEPFFSSGFRRVYCFYVCYFQED